MYNKNLNKMTKEQLRMQMLASIITEGQYKAKLNEGLIGGNTMSTRLNKQRLMEMAGLEAARLNESTSLQLTPEEAGKLKYILEQKLNDWKDSPGFWSEHIVAVESILKKMK